MRMPLMKLVRRVGSGGMIPSWYGIAWEDYAAHEAVCLPMPLNVLAVLARSVWIWMKSGYVCVHSNPRDAYQQGYRDALKNG